MLFKRQVAALYAVACLLTLLSGADFAAVQAQEKVAAPRIVNIINFFRACSEGIGDN